MRKTMPLLVSIFLSTSVHAGFLGGVLEGVTANALSGKSAPAYLSENRERMKQVNSFLWHQHDTNSYDESTNFYVQWLEAQLNAAGFDDIGSWDTLAWVYKDNGDKKRAIEIYETRIMPWVKVRYQNTSENIEFRNRWESYFKKIKE